MTCAMLLFDAAGSGALADLLRQREITAPMLAAGLAIAFGLGAVHALSPGHGKTIVAAYLVGARGTMKHAMILGGTVTFTHTISVFALGLATLFLSNYVVPERIFPVLGVISGLAIVAVGLWLLRQRLRAAMHGHAHHHGHHHDHHHDHDHHPDHDHDHHHHHDHPHYHSHVPEGEVTLGSLLALGASGGLVPCPSALVLLLSSIALGHVGAGLLLLVSFSAGLAGVLILIGGLVVYARHLLPDSKSAHPAFRWLPVASAVVIVGAGVVMTAAAGGWLRI